MKCKEGIISAYKSGVTMATIVSCDEYDFTAKHISPHRGITRTTLIVKVFSVGCHGNLSRFRESLIFVRAHTLS